MFPTKVPMGMVLAISLFAGSANVPNANGQAKDSPETPPSMEALWADLRGDDAMKAFQAIGAMISAPKQSVPFLSKHLQAVPLPDAKKIEQHIIDLDSRDFKVRTRAKEELETMCDAAKDAMQKALTSDPPPSLEKRRTLEALLAKAEKPEFKGELLRTWRAIEVLEGIGSPEARQVLQVLAKGAPGAHVTEDAKRALRELAKRNPS